MARDTNSNASTGGGSSSILTSILPCIRPRRSKPSTPEPGVGAKNEESKRQIQEEDARGQSSQSAGTTLELPNTPLVTDEGDGLEATMMREFARVSVQPVSSPWLAEVAEQESKSQSKGDRQASLEQLTDQPQNKTSDATPLHNTVPNIPQEPFPESTPQDTSPSVLQEAQLVDPEPRSPANLADTLPETNKEVTEPDNTTEKMPTEEDEGTKQEEALGQEKALNASVPLEVPCSAAEEHTVESIQKESKSEISGGDAEKSELPKPGSETDGSIDKGEEVMDTRA